jgi:hypothetical protein
MTAFNYLDLLLVFDHYCENNGAIGVSIINRNLCVQYDPSGELIFGDRILKINDLSG